MLMIVMSASMMIMMLFLHNILKATATISLDGDVYNDDDGGGGDSVHVQSKILKGPASIPLGGHILLLEIDKN